MEINAAHLDLIRQAIIARGLTHPRLSDDLTDHLACMVESSAHTDFDLALQEALAAFGEEEFILLNEAGIHIYQSKKEEVMKKTMFILAYLAACFTTSGLLFKIMHWPGASILLVVGVALLNFGVLPVYFYDRYRRVADGSHAAMH